jgi:hypothetical protein
LVVVTGKKKIKGIGVATTKMAGGICRRFSEMGGKKKIKTILCVEVNFRQLGDSGIYLSLSWM